MQSIDRVSLCVMVMLKLHNVCVDANDLGGDLDDPPRRFAAHFGNGGVASDGNSMGGAARRDEVCDDISTMGLRRPAGR